MPSPWRRFLSCKLNCDLEMHDPKLAASNVSEQAVSSSSQQSERPRSGATPAGNMVYGKERPVPELEMRTPQSESGSSYVLPSNSFETHNHHTSCHLNKLPSTSYDWPSVAPCKLQYRILTHTRSVGGATLNHDPLTACHECGQHHQTAKDTVIELKPGDSAGKIVEIIFQAGWLRKNSTPAKIGRILKLFNTHESIARFEEYRDMVKTKAEKLSKKHSRCIADGNELLRFYCTDVGCSLGNSRYSSLCCSPSCNVCQILRFGFPCKKELGICTTASSGKAHDSLVAASEKRRGRRAMLVCRVIAGRVKRICSQDDSQEESFNSIGFVSGSGEASPSSNLDELVVFNPQAVLPCFVVIYSC